MWAMLSPAILLLWKDLSGFNITSTLIVNYLCTDQRAACKVLLAINQSLFCLMRITVEFCRLPVAPLGWVIERLSHKIRLVDLVRRTLGPISVEFCSTLCVMLLTTLYLIYAALKGSL